MTQLEIAVHVTTEELRTPAEAGERESVRELAYSAVATGVATPEIAQRLAAPEEREGDGTGLWQAIKNWLTGTRISEGQRRRAHWRWPLFVLSCPDVPDATTDLVFSRANAEGESWKLKLFGAGIERKTTMTITDTFSGTANPGQCRLLFVGSDVDIIELVTTGDVVSRGSRLEIVEGTTVIGWVDLPRQPAWTRPTSRFISLDYSWADASSRQVWRSERAYSLMSDLVLAPELSPVEVGPALSYQASTTVALQAALPGGVRWSMDTPTRCAGLVVHAQL
jgi:hypothetical protein